MEYHLLSDELLVKLLRVDDREAFEEIYRRFWKSLFKMAQNKFKSTEVIEERPKPLKIFLPTYLQL